MHTAEDNHFTFPCSSYPQRAPGITENPFGAAQPQPKPQRGDRRRRSGFAQVISGQNLLATDHGPPATCHRAWTVSCPPGKDFACSSTNYHAVTRWRAINYQVAPQANLSSHFGVFAVAFLKATAKAQRCEGCQVPFVIDSFALDGRC